MTRPPELPPLLPEALNQQVDKYWCACKGMSASLGVKRIYADYASCCRQPYIAAPVSSVVGRHPSATPGATPLLDYDFHERFQQLLQQRWVGYLTPDKWEGEMRALQVAFSEAARMCVEPILFGQGLSFGRDVVFNSPAADAVLHDSHTAVFAGGRIVVQVVSHRAAAKLYVESTRLPTLRRAKSLPIHTPLSILLSYADIHFVVSTAAPLVLGTKATVGPLGRSSSIVPTLEAHCRGLAGNQGTVSTVVGSDGRVYLHNTADVFGHLPPDSLFNKSTHLAARAIAEVVEGEPGSARQKVGRVQVDVRAILRKHGVPMRLAGSVMRLLAGASKFVVYQELLARAVLFAWRAQLYGSTASRSAVAGPLLNQLLATMLYGGTTGPVAATLVGIASRKFNLSATDTPNVGEVVFSRVVTIVARLLRTSLCTQGVGQLVVVVAPCPAYHGASHDCAGPSLEEESVVSRFQVRLAKREYDLIASSTVDEAFMRKHILDATFCFRTFAMVLQLGSISDVEVFSDDYFTVGEFLVKGIVHVFVQEVHNLDSTVGDPESLMLMKDAQAHPLYESFACPPRVYRRLTPNQKVRCRKIRTLLTRSLFEEYDDRALRAEKDYATAICEAGEDVERGLRKLEELASAVKVKGKMTANASGGAPGFDMTLVDVVPSLYYWYLNLQHTTAVKHLTAHSTIKGHFKWATPLLEQLISDSVEDEKKYSIMLVEMYLSAAKFHQLTGDKSTATKIADRGCDFSQKYGIPCDALYGIAGRPVEKVNARLTKYTMMVVHVWVVRFRKKMTLSKAVQRIGRGYSARRRDMWRWLPPITVVLLLQRVARGFLDRRTLTAELLCLNAEADDRHDIASSEALGILDILIALDGAARQRVSRMLSYEQVEVDEQTVRWALEDSVRSLRHLQFLDGDELSIRCGLEREEACGFNAITIEASTRGTEEDEVVSASIDHSVPTSRPQVGRLLVHLVDDEESGRSKLEFRQDDARCEIREEFSLGRTEYFYTQQLVAAQRFGAFDGEEEGGREAIETAEGSWRRQLRKDYRASERFTLTAQRICGTIQRTGRGYVVRYYEMVRVAEAGLLRKTSAIVVVQQFARQAIAQLETQDLELASPKAAEERRRALLLQSLARRQLGKKQVASGQKTAAAAAAAADGGTHAVEALQRVMRGMGSRCVLATSRNRHGGNVESEASELATEEMNSSGVATLQAVGRGFVVRRDVGMEAYIFGSASESPTPSTHRHAVVVEHALQRTLVHLSGCANLLHQRSCTLSSVLAMTQSAPEGKATLGSANAGRMAKPRVEREEEPSAAVKSQENAADEPPSSFFLTDI